MLILGALGFAAPWMLTALIVLPVIWLLLRVMPPAPKRVIFPAVAFLFGLDPRDETPARTPWWLILLRLIVATLVILGLAEPLLNPAARLAGNGPLLLIVDDGWAGARDWATRRQAAIDLVDLAERDSRPAILVTTAVDPTAPNGLSSGIQRASEIRTRLQGLQPKPWPADRTQTLAAIEALKLEGPVQSVMFADGLDDPAIPRIAETLQRLGGMRVVTPANADLPVLVMPPENRSGDTEVVVKRAPTAEPALYFLRALATDGRLIAREPVRFEANQASAATKIKVPVELRNTLARVDVEGQDAVGATVLFDDRWQRRPVGVITGTGSDGTQSLLDDAFYLERALGPFAEIRRGGVGDLLRSPLAVILISDNVALSQPERSDLARFIETGGVLVRFAGTKLATVAQERARDDLLPVRLRAGGRTLGTALQWSEPARLAPFDATSPFAGLTIPGDVTVTRQVLAEPAIDLADKTWAKLTDGTPLVTASKRGQGTLVLFHVPASADWSNLPISGLFVEMLRRMVQLGRGVEGSTASLPLPPIETLDAFARLGTPPASATMLAGEGAVGVDPRHPPGFYGTDALRRAINLSQTVTDIRVLGPLPAGVQRSVLGGEREVDLKPWLLVAALLGIAFDFALALVLRGLMTGVMARTATKRAAIIAVLAIPLAFTGGNRADAQSTQAAPPKPATQTVDDSFGLIASLDTRLGYVVTGVTQVDTLSRAGLTGLATVLKRRTAVEQVEPMAVDIEKDELAFFPMLYWPITSEQADPSPAAIERINFYLRNGGTILFDTRDDAGMGFDERNAGTGAKRLQSLVRGMEIPALMPVQADHVLTKTFYLLQEFPGRYSGGSLWVEASEHANDEVSSVIVGSNDYAAAWAVDGSGRPMVAISPGGEPQREMAYRVGVNLVMYALTGNYKSDQVHVPSILERLGQ